MKPESKAPNLRYYLLLIAFVMIIAILAYLRSPTNSHYNPEHGYSAQNSNPSADILASMPPNEDAISKAEKPYTAGQKEQYAADRSDLAAQWAMAQYTFVGLAVGVIGIILIVLTYYQSSRAAYFTEQALNDTRISSKRELRAYLKATPFAKNLNDTFHIPTIIIKVENMGATPAIYTVASLLITGFETGKTGDSCKVTIAPNSSEDIIWELKKSELIETLKIRPVDMVFTITYNDIFMGNRHIEMAFSISYFDFPDTNPTKIHTSGRVDFDTGRREGGPDIPYPNPRHVVERLIVTDAYKDDLQEEAEKYAEANKVT